MENVVCHTTKEPTIEVIIGSLIDKILESVDTYIVKQIENIQSDTARMSTIKIPMAEIEKKLSDNGASFHDKLFEIIDKSGMNGRDIWKRANIDRKLYSKIKCDLNCKPKKKTIMSLCIALQLDKEQSGDLMSRAGLAFNPGSKFDMIVEWAIENGERDIYHLNSILFRYTGETLNM